MYLWRISNHAELTGMGGQLLSGRWHTAALGKRIVYLSEHPALALIENLANLRGNAHLYPSSYQLMRISSPGDSSESNTSSPDLSHVDLEDIEQTQTLGDQWLTNRVSALLRVPSAPSPESWNYLFNPLHPDASLVHMDWAKQVSYDRRLFHLSE